MSTIQRLCIIFYNNPNKSYIPSDFKGKRDWNYNSVKKQCKRLQKYGLIRQLSSKRYILADPDKAYEFIENCGDTFSSPSKIHLPHRVRAKAHNLSIGTIDLSGEPIKWMLKMNMLTKPKPNDPAQNVGLRPGIAKKFNMRASLINPAKTYIYPKIKGWENEFLNIFSWCNDFINRFKDISENMEIAINYKDLQKLNDNFKDIPFEEVKGLILEHNGLRIQLCSSQFEEGEACILTESIEETCSLADKITYGNRDLAQAIKETSLEKGIITAVRGLREDIDRLPFNIGQIVSHSTREAVKGSFEDIGDIIKKAVRDGILEAFSNFTPNDNKNSDPAIR